MTEMPLPRVLVIGANGQLGRELTTCLQGKAEVIAAARDTTPAFDLSQPDSLADALHGVAADVVVNCAAYTAVDKAESEPELAETVNATAAGRIADSCAALGIPLIHYSTDYVFDGSSTRPYLEDDPTAPLGVYGLSKLHGEQAIQASGCEHYIFRTSWVYAAHGQNFLNTMLRLATERDALSIVSDQRGAPTWTGYLAQQTLRLIEQLGQAQNHPPPGLYHLSCAGETSWFDFAGAIFRLAVERRLIERVPSLTPITTEQYPTPARRPKYSVLDNHRAQARLGMQPMQWETALEYCMAGKT